MTKQLTFLLAVLFTTATLAVPSHSNGHGAGGGNSGNGGGNGGSQSDNGGNSNNNNGDNNDESDNDEGGDISDRNGLDGGESEWYPWEDPTMLPPSDFKGGCDIFQSLSIILGKDVKCDKLK